MSTLMKRIFLCLIGMLAGLASWPITEFMLPLQAYFPTLLIFTVTIGVIFGFIMGSFFCSSEGVILNDKPKIFSGIITGAVVGLIGGIIGFLAGQAALFIIANHLMDSMRSFNTIGIPVSRSVGWAFLGSFIGITEGIRAGSIKKIGIGIIGGFLGGALGGLALEYLKFVIPNIIYARLIGLLIFGLFIGLFYGLIEKSFSFGILKLLNGKFKGKDFLINQRKIKLGTSTRNDIRLTDYDNIEKNHVELVVKKGNVFIKNLVPENPIKVNDDVINEHELRMEDVVKIGNAKFMFKFK